MLRVKDTERHRESTEPRISHAFVLNLSGALSCVSDRCTPGLSDAQYDSSFPTGLLYILHRDTGTRLYAYRISGGEFANAKRYIIRAYGGEVSSGGGGEETVGKREKQSRAVVDNCQEGARVNYSQQISDSFPRARSTFGDQSDTLIFPVVSSRTGEEGRARSIRAEPTRFTGRTNQKHVPLCGYNWVTGHPPPGRGIISVSLVERTNERTNASSPPPTLVSPRHERHPAFSLPLPSYPACVPVGGSWMDLINCLL